MTHLSGGKAANRLDGQISSGSYSFYNDGYDLHRVEGESLKG